MTKEHTKDSCQQVQTLITEGSYVMAAIRLESILKTRPVNPEPYSAWVKLHVNFIDKLVALNIDYSALEESLSETLTERPDFAPAYVARGACRYARAVDKHGALRTEYLTQIVSTSWMDFVFRVVPAFIQSDKAIKSFPGYEQIKEFYELCIADCTQAIAIDVKLPFAFKLRSFCNKQLARKKEMQNDEFLANENGVEMRVGTSWYKMQFGISSGESRVFTLASQLVDYMAHVIAVLLVVPAVTSVQWTGGILSLLAWSVAFTAASNCVAILLSVIIVFGGFFLYAFLRQDRINDEAEVNIRPEHIGCLPVVLLPVKILSAAVSFLVIAAALSPTTLFIPSSAAGIAAALTVGVVVSLFSAPFSVYAYFTLKKMFGSPTVARSS